MRNGWMDGWTSNRERGVVAQVEYDELLGSVIDFHSKIEFEHLFVRVGCIPALADIPCYSICEEANPLY